MNIKIKDLYVLLNTTSIITNYLIKDWGIDIDDIDFCIKSTNNNYIQLSYLIILDDTSRICDKVENIIEIIQEIENVQGMSNIQIEYKEDWSLTFDVHILINKEEQ